MLRKHFYCKKKNYWTKKIFLDARNVFLAQEKFSWFKKGFLHLRNFFLNKKINFCCAVYLTPQTDNFNSSKITLHSLYGWKTYIITKIRNNENSCYVLNSLFISISFAPWVLYNMCAYSCSFLLNPLLKRGVVTSLHPSLYLNQNLSYKL